MHYRGESEGVPLRNVSVDFVDQEWYKVLTRKATSISQVEERALVGAVGYSLLNVLDPKAASAMVEAILPEGKPVWLDQIRDRFLHPTSDSFAAYANVILGEDDGDDLDDAIDPTREEGAVNEHVNEPTGDDVDVPSNAVEQLEARKKKKVDRSEKKKKVKEPVAKAPRKQPSNFSLLDYVVVSDTLSGLDAGDKCVERDPDDDATLMEIMKKNKVLEDKKKELDEQAAAALAAKKSKLQKEAPLHLQSRRLTWEFLVQNAAPRKVDISKITPPASPPSRTFDMSPPHDDLGEKKTKDDVEVEQVGEGGAAGAGGDAAGAGGGASGADGEGFCEGVDTEAESSEATPRHTIYTKVIRGSGQGGASGTHHSPYSFVCPPPAERLFQKRRNRLDLLDDHINVGVNFFTTSQEIAREWQFMGEDTLEFENTNKAFAEEREKFNAKKKGLAWRVADAKEKLAKEKQLNLQTLPDAIVRLSGEKRKISDEAEQERVAHQKREQEYIQRIAKLEKFAEEKVVEVKASEILVEEVTADCRWLLAHF
ncbi:hypothetical protein Hanom_Chr03g00193171 [Helianthus anomalus]